MRKKEKTFLTALVALALVAAVHPTAVLRSPASSVAAGSMLPLVGGEFGPGASTTLMLRGPLAEYRLRDVTADGNGSFQIELAIPADVRPGQYRVLALAEDGDVSASLELTVTAAATVPMHQEPAEGEARHGEGMGDSMTMPAVSARADEMPIERSRAGMEWGLIGLLVGLAAGGGLALLKRA